jgi:hypothetical protein
MLPSFVIPCCRVWFTSYIGRAETVYSRYRPDSLFGEIKFAFRGVTEVVSCPVPADLNRSSGGYGGLKILLEYTIRG